MSVTKRSRKQKSARRPCPCHLARNPRTLVCGYPFSWMQPLYIYGYLCWTIPFPSRNSPVMPHLDLPHALQSSVGFSCCKRASPYLGFLSLGSLASDTGSATPPACHGCTVISAAQKAQHQMSVYLQAFPRAPLCRACTQEANSTGTGVMGLPAVGWLGVAFMSVYSVTVHLLALCMETTLLLISERVLPGLQKPQKLKPSGWPGRQYPLPATAVILP